MTHSCTHPWTLPKAQENIITKSYAGNDCWICRWPVSCIILLKGTCSKTYYKVAQYVYQFYLCVQMMIYVFDVFLTIPPAVFPPSFQYHLALLTRLHQHSLLLEEPYPQTRSQPLQFLSGKSRAMYASKKNTYICCHRERLAFQIIQGR